MEYANRDYKRGGGVAVYIKEAFSYTECENIIDLDKSIEHYWLEVSGLNKNSLYLVGIFYQPSSIEHEKRERLDHFEEIIAHVPLNWNGATIVTGDFNIDLIDGDKISVNKDNNILDAYRLTQHISYPTRHGKSLIDHISTNIPKKNCCENVTPCETISDHGAPLVVSNIQKKNRSFDLDIHLYVMKNHSILKTILMTSVNFFYPQYIVLTTQIIKLKL